MGVTLKISKPPAREYFISGETVSGSVELGSCRPSTVSSVNVYLEGRLTTAVRHTLGCQESSFRKCERLLFANRQDLTACLSETTQSDGAGSRKVILPFALDFPSLLLDELETLQSEKPGLTGLPPSIDIASEYLKISVSYSVRVMIKRIGAFKLNNTTKCIISFRPLSATQACLEDHTALTRTVSYLSTASLGVKSPAPDNRLGLPPYTPSVLFEVQIPPCKTIFPGEYISLGLAFVIPDELRSLFATIWIHRVWIQLRTNTTATIGSKREVSIQHTDCCKMEGNMPLNLPEGNSRIELPSELWEHNTYPTILPSFHVAEARREHQLEIILQFAWSSKDNVHTVVNRNDVVVESDAQLPAEPPPPYD